VKFAIVDIETTGGNPKSSKITEIAIYISNGQEIVDEFVTLLNPESKIPPFIVQLTGINDKMVENAPRFYEVAKKIIEITEDCIFVAHNVGFDYGVIRHEFRNLGYDFRKKQLCTVRASRYMIQGEASYSLGKLCRSLGIELEGRHRAGGDALATTHLFHRLMNQSERDLHAFVQDDLNPKILHPNLDLESLDELPNKAGVYKFFNEFNQLIYIGKSKHIKSRVEQHLKNVKTQKGIKMQAEIARVEYELTGSEWIAFLLESELIKIHKPIYNRMLRRNSFPFGLFVLENEEGYKTLQIARISKTNEIPLTTFTTQKEAHTYLSHVCETYTLCQKLCGLYTSSSSCFAFQVKQCLGACIGKETVETYNDRVQSFVAKLLFESENFYILDAGRTRYEKSLIKVENGTYVGYGFIPHFALKHKHASWSKYIDFRKEDKDVRTIIQLLLRKENQEQIVRF
jgi:DNA polymerase-3 subunit epsilon